MEDFTQITNTLKNGGIAVVRTDTIYGIVALASNQQAVEKVYAAKHRYPAKQCIVLIAAVPEASPYAELIQRYSAHASSPTTVIVPATDEPSWILRGGDTIAYRVVKDEFLQSVILEVGPIIAPSANPEGLEPAADISTAKEYFGNTVDTYIDGGTVPADTQASQIIEVSTDHTARIIRGGSEQIATRHSSGGLVFHDGKLLLIHWAPPRDSYDFPKGTIEPGETSEQACVREVLEETGYKTRIIDFIGSNEFDFQTPSGEWRHKINDYYLLELADLEPHEAAREEHETFENAWVPVDEAEAIITRPMNKEIFSSAISMLQSTCNV